MKTSLLCFLLCCCLTVVPAAGQGGDGRAPLPTESADQENYAFLKEELQAYRAFVEQERREHRQFLEDAYQRSLIIISVFLGVLAVSGGVLTFFGIRAFRDIRKSFELEYRNQIKNILDTELLATEQKITALGRLVHQEQQWHQARLRFIGPEAQLISFRKEELAFFGGAKPNFTVAPLREEEELNRYNVIVHYFSPDEHQEDLMLQAVLRRLQGRSIPLVVYTHGQWLERGTKTKQQLDAYQFHTMANNIITLLNNTSDAFRLKLNA